MIRMVFALRRKSGMSVAAGALRDGCLLGCGALIQTDSTIRINS